MRMTTRLKELFERPWTFVMAGGMKGTGAKMADVAAKGYEGFLLQWNVDSHVVDPGHSPQTLARAFNLYGDNVYIVILAVPHGRRVMPEQAEREVTIILYLRLLA